MLEQGDQVSSEDRDLPKGWLAVYVPRPGTSLREELAPGSGLVGSEESDDERMRIDFEGNVHDIPELARYADRVERAGERHQWTGPGEETGYPTSSCAYVERGELIRVGRFDPLTRRLEIEDRSKLAEWLNVEAVPDRELEPSNR